MDQFTRLDQRLKRLWSARRRYTRLRDWLYSIYHRILLRFPRLPLPGRNQVREVQLAGVGEPFYVRLGTTDWYILEEIFIDRVYEPVVGRQIEGLRNIVDLGANSGFSIRLWQLTYPAACVIAVEPDAENLQMCRHNVLNGRQNDKLKLVQACVAGKSRSVSLNRSGGAWKFNMQELRDVSQESIQAMTLPQILASCGVDSPIDLLKCDIEGAESEVFADCSAWIDRVRNLVIEVHPSYSPEHFLEDLNRAGGRFNLYCRMLCDGGAELLFLQQIRTRLN